MPVTSQKLKLYYYDVPKIACTSLKTMFWQIENGILTQDASSAVGKSTNILQRIKNKARGNIHYTDGYQTYSWQASPPPPSGFETLTVVRDPILRLHSAWKNKVMHSVFESRDELLDLTNEGLSDNPDFGTFIDHFEHYRDVSRPARVHTHDYTYHLGPKLSYFDHVFKLEKLSELIEFLSARVEQKVIIPHENKTEEPNRSDQLSTEQIEKLLKITEQDYIWLDGLYSAEKAIERICK